MQNSMMVKQETGQKKQAPGPVQLAQVVGNSAAVQGMPVIQRFINWNSQEAWRLWGVFHNDCTDYFIRRHICGHVYHGEPPATEIGVGRMLSIIKAYKKKLEGTGGNRITIVGNSVTYKGQGIADSFALSGGKFHHYDGWYYT